MEVIKFLKSACLILRREGVEILIPPFLHVHYSVQILSFYLRIWMEVNKSFKTFIWKTFLKITCGFLVTAKPFYKLNIHNYLKLKF